MRRVRGKARGYGVGEMSGYDGTLRNIGKISLLNRQKARFLDITFII